MTDKRNIFEIKKWHPRSDVRRRGGWGHARNLTGIHFSSKNIFVSQSEIRWPGFYFEGLLMRAKIVLDEAAMEKENTSRRLYKLVEVTPLPFQDQPKQVREGCPKTTIDMSTDSETYTRTPSPPPSKTPTRSPSALSAWTDASERKRASSDETLPSATPNVNQNLNVSCRAHSKRRSLSRSDSANSSAAQATPTRARERRPRSKSRSLSSSSRSPSTPPPRPSRIIRPYQFCRRCGASIHKQKFKNGSLPFGCGYCGAKLWD